jgi:hypothetical protein
MKSRKKYGIIIRGTECVSNNKNGINRFTQFDKDIKRIVSVCVCAINLQCRLNTLFLLVVRSQKIKMSKFTIIFLAINSISNIRWNWTQISCSNIFSLIVYEFTEYAAAWNTTFILFVECNNLKIKLLISNKPSQLAFRCSLLRFISHFVNIARMPSSHTPNESVGR